MMKSKRAEKIISDHSFASVEYGRQCMATLVAHEAVELAEEDAREIAIMAHCKACYVGELRMECGHSHPENCQSLADFKKYYDNES